jgi:hypothetical protein
MKAAARAWLCRPGGPRDRSCRQSTLGRPVRKLPRDIPAVTRAGLMRILVFIADGVPALPESCP